MVVVVALPANKVAAIQAVCCLCRDRKKLAQAQILAVVPMLFGEVSLYGEVECN